MSLNYLSYKRPSGVMFGGIPPYQWIGEQIAPELGYSYGNDTLPIVEYYGFFKPEEGTHEYCYLYVPIKENNAMTK